MKTGFIGAGNMAGAIIGGLINANIVKEENLFVCDNSQAALEGIQKKFSGVNISTDNRAFLDKVDVLFLAVKPHIYSPVIEQIKEVLPEKVIVVTIAAGQTMASVKERFGRDIKLVRTMPNTPALVGEGMTAACPGGNPQ